MSSLRRGHANLLCIVPILADDLLRGSEKLAARIVPTHFRGTGCLVYGLLWKRVFLTSPAKQIQRSCSVTVITGDSESLNPGSIPGRTLVFFVDPRRAGPWVFLSIPGRTLVFFVAPRPARPWVFLSIPGRTLVFCADPRPARPWVFLSIPGWTLVF